MRQSQLVQSLSVYSTIKAVTPNISIRQSQSVCFEAVTVRQSPSVSKMRLSKSLCKMRQSLSMQSQSV